MFHVCLADNCIYSLLGCTMYFDKSIRAVINTKQLSFRKLNEILLFPSTSHNYAPEQPLSKVLVPHPNTCGH